MMDCLGTARIARRNTYESKKIHSTFRSIRHIHKIDTHLETRLLTAEVQTGRIFMLVVHVAT